MPFPKEEVIYSIIEGIPSETLRNLARMHLFSSVQLIIRAFNTINLKSEQGANRDAVACQETTWKPWSGQATERSEEAIPASKTSRIGGRGILKCYECNGMGHYAKAYSSKNEEKPRED